MSSAGNRPCREPEPLSTCNFFFEKQCDFQNHSHDIGDARVHTSYRMYVRNTERGSYNHDAMCVRCSCVVRVCVCTPICVLKPNRELPFLTESSNILKSQQHPPAHTGVP